MFLAGCNTETALRTDQGAAGKGSPEIAVPQNQPAAKQIDARITVAPVVAPHHALGCAEGLPPDADNPGDARFYIVANVPVMSLLVGLWDDDADIFADDFC